MCCGFNLSHTYNAIAGTTPFQEISSIPMPQESSSGCDATSDDVLDLIDYYQVGLMDLEFTFVLLAATIVVDRGLI